MQICMQIFDTAVCPWHNESGGSYGDHKKKADCEEESPGEGTHSGPPNRCPSARSAGDSVSAARCSPDSPGSLSGPSPTGRGESR